jgi:hypothetical protein
MDALLAGITLCCFERLEKELSMPYHSKHINVLIW